MWFKNLQLYRFTGPFEQDPEALGARLADKAFHPVARHEPFSLGWVPPLGEGSDQLVHAAGGYLMMCLRREERVLPASTVRETLEARMAEIETKTARKVRGKARTELKDEVIRDLLPRAFTRSRLTYAYADTSAGWLVIDAASPRKAEEVTRVLRESLGSLPLRPADVEDAPDAVMTSWLASAQLPDGFVLGEECDLGEPGEGGALVRLRRQDLGADEIDAHLEAGKRASRLAVTFEERLSFVIDEHLGLKRLRFLDVVQEEAASANAESEAERFDSDFAIMTLEVARLLPRLMDAFGGLISSDDKDAA